MSVHSVHYVHCVHSVRSGCTAVAPERLARKDGILTKSKTPKILGLDFFRAADFESAETLSTLSILYYLVHPVHGDHCFHPVCTTIATEQNKFTIEKSFIPC